jgi:hypothetical protein
MSSDKPHNGELHDWFKMPAGDLGLGFVVFGRSHGHPVWGGGEMRTSYVVAHDEATGEIETRNSRYTLVGPELK